MKKKPSKLIRNKSDIIDEASQESFPTSDPPAWTLGTDKEISRYLKAEKHELTRKIAKDHLSAHKILFELTKMIHFVENHQSIQKEKLHSFIEKFCLFLEKIHAEKEEILYPYFKKQASLSDYMIKALKEEHQYAKKILSTLRVAIHSEGNLDKDKRKKLLDMLKELNDHYQNHLAKEEEYILPYLKTSLNDQEQDDILSKYEEIERKYIKQEHELL